MKICPNCGAGCREDARFCDVCDTPQNAAPATPFDADSTAAPYADDMMPGNSFAGCGLGGWMLVFFITGVIGIIASLVQVTTLNNLVPNLYDAMHLAATEQGVQAAFTLMMTALGLALLSLVFEGVFLFQVMVRMPRFLRTMQEGRAIAFASFLLTFTAAYLLGIPTDFFLSLISSVGGFFLMTLYYCKSARVYAYMKGDESFKKKALFRFR